MYICNILYYFVRIHIYIYMYVYTCKYSTVRVYIYIQRDNVVYWKTKRKIRNDLQYIYIYICTQTRVDVGYLNSVLSGSRHFGLPMEDFVVTAQCTAFVSSYWQTHMTLFNTHKKLHEETIVYDSEVIFFFNSAC